MHKNRQDKSYNGLHPWALLMRSDRWKLVETSFVKEALPTPIRPQFSAAAPAMIP